MRIAVLVNDAGEISPRQTTSLLLRAAAARGHEVWAFGVDDLDIRSDLSMYVEARPVRPAPTSAALVAELCARAPRRLRLDDLDALLVRTNPGRDAARAGAHECALAGARLAAARGVLVLSDPEGLACAATKLSLFELPAHVRPQTFIARSAAAVDDILRSLRGAAIVKPVRGTRAARTSSSWPRDIASTSTRSSTSSAATAT